MRFWRSPGAEEPHDITLGLPADDRINDIPPAISAVDVAVAQGTAFPHAELVEPEVGVIAGAIAKPVPRRALLIAMGRANRAFQVQHDVLKPVTVREQVDRLVGQRIPVLEQGQRLSFERAHLGS